jgi:glutamyl-tRNA reductase
MAEATARALMERGLGELVVINRTVGTAREIAERLGGLGLGFDCLADELGQADVVVCSTDAPHPVISADQVTAALHDRPTRPMVLIDIAVPRDVEPAASAVHGAVLFDIDDLERVVAQHRDERQEHARRAEVLVDEEVDRYAEPAEQIRCPTAFLASCHEARPRGLLTQKDVFRGRESGNQIELLVDHGDAGRTGLLRRAK